MVVAVSTTIASYDETGQHPGSNAPNVESTAPIVESTAPIYESTATLVGATTTPNVESNTISIGSNAPTVSQHFPESPPLIGIFIIQLCADSFFFCFFYVF